MRWPPQERKQGAQEIQKLGDAVTQLVIHLFNDLEDAISTRGQYIEVAKASRCADMARRASHVEWQWVLEPMW